MLNVGIWRDQVINRDYYPTDHHQAEYRRFIWKIAGENRDKYKAFQTVIGYLLHSFKTNSNNKAIIFNDEVISENPNGRSGKGIFWNALKQLRKVQSLDGKTFDFNKSFPYQSVATDCQVLVFDDVKKSFNFENLFSVITEGISIEYKGKDSIKLDVTESPKIIITTNYTIQGDSASFNARKYEVEMSSYFNDNYTPIMEFGHELFNEWTDDEWAAFDNYMMGCVVYFIANKFKPDENGKCRMTGIIKPADINKSERKLTQSTSEEFTSWADSQITIGRKYDRKKDLFNYFVDANSEFKNLLPRTFNGWLQAWAKPRIRKG